MKLRKIFIWIVVLHASICLMLSGFFMFYSYNSQHVYTQFVDSELISMLSPYSGNMEEFAQWLQDLHVSSTTCSTITECVGRIFVHVVELFFMYIIIPLTAMFATFVIDQSMTNRSISNLLWGRLRSSSNITMPPLENLGERYKPHRASNQTTQNRKNATIQSTRAPTAPIVSRSTSGLVFDETFGFISKEILDLWEEHDRDSKASTSLVEKCGSDQSTLIKKNRELPPVRNIKITSDHKA